MWPLNLCDVRQRFLLVISAMYFSAGMLVSLAGPLLASLAVISGVVDMQDTWFIFVSRSLGFITSCIIFFWMGRAHPIMVWVSFVGLLQIFGAFLVTISMEPWMLMVSMFVQGMSIGFADNIVNYASLAVWKGRDAMGRLAIVYLFYGIGAFLAPWVSHISGSSVESIDAYHGDPESLRIRIIVTYVMATAVMFPAVVYSITEFRRRDRRAISAIGEFKSCLSPSMRRICMSYAGISVMLYVFLETLMSGYLFSVVSTHYGDVELAEGVVEAFWALFILSRAILTFSYKYILNPFVYFILPVCVFIASSVLLLYDAPVAVSAVLYGFSLGWINPFILYYCDTLCSIDTRGISMFLLMGAIGELGAPYFAQVSLASPTPESFPILLILVSLFLLVFALSLASLRFIQWCSRHTNT